MRSAHQSHGKPDIALLTELVENGTIQYCRECGRYFDVRSGCETDIRLDERENIVELINKGRT